MHLSSHSLYPGLPAFWSRLDLEKPRVKESVMSPAPLSTACAMCCPPGAPAACQVSMRIPHANHMSTAGPAASEDDSAAGFGPGQQFGADGDKATAAAMKALRDEAKALRDEKAAKKAAFDSEYDVGELRLPAPPLSVTVYAGPALLGFPVERG